MGKQSSKIRKLEPLQLNNRERIPEWWWKF